MKKIIVILMGIALMFSIMSCDTNGNDDDLLETLIILQHINSSNNGGNGGKSENVTPTTPSDENGSGNGGESGSVTPTTSCTIGQRNVLDLNYIAHYENSTPTTFNDIRANDENTAKSAPFTMRCNVSPTSATRDIVVTVTYNNGTLNFAINRETPYYNITNVTYDGSSTVDIYIQHN